MTSVVLKDPRTVARATQRESLLVALEARKVCASYAKVTRLENVSAQFERNRVTAILGPSGCGKSTLLRVLNRTLELIPGARVDAGEVLLDGRDVYAAGTAAAAVRTQVGVLQQKPTPFPMSILDNTLFGARYHRIAHDPAVHARIYLERVGLWSEVCDRLEASALALSGGQQQRLCLARTLAVQPSIILMDEPCSALDPRASGVIEALIRELAREYTIVIVTHNIAQARRVADACLFMLDGRVVEAGSRDQVLIEPRDPVVRAFVTGQLG